MRTTRNLTFANLVSVVALLVAVTGVAGVGAYAHGQIGSAQLKDNAVKTRHIADGQVKTTDLGARSVTRNKLAANARPTVIRYDLGEINFSESAGWCSNVPALTATQQKRSAWSSTVTWPNGDVADGGAYDLDTWYRPGTPAKVCVFDLGGLGGTVSNVSVFRTVQTSQVSAPPRVPAPGRRAGSN